MTMEQRCRFSPLRDQAPDVCVRACVRAAPRYLSSTLLLYLAAALVFLFTPPLSAVETQPAPEDWVFIDNGTIRLGVIQSSGAGIGWFSASGSDWNLINHYDRGRLVQQSYYGQADGSLWNNQPWRWNPVQGGDWKGKPARVLELRTTASTLYARTEAMHWASGVPLPEVTFEQWITLTGPVAHLRYRMSYTGGTAHPARDQELPAVFVDPKLETLVLYQGETPWTGGALHRSKPGWPNESRTSTERWAAYVNADDYGFGAFVPMAARLTCYRFGQSLDDPSACSYFAPVARFPITPGLVFEYDVYLTHGRVDEMRSRFQELHRARELEETAPLKLALVPAQAHDLEMTELGGGTYDVRTTGGDPYLFTGPFPVRDLSRTPVLSFEYFSTRGTDHLQVFLVPPLRESNSLMEDGLAISEGWSTHALDLTPALTLAEEQPRMLRLDFGTAPNRTIQIRNLQLRAPTDQERRLKERGAELRIQELERDAALRGYLETKREHQITRVSVNTDSVEIEGIAAEPAEGLVLIEVPIWMELEELGKPASEHRIERRSDGRFVVRLERHTTLDGQAHDRLISRWALARKTQGGPELVSHLRYADAVAAERDLPRERPRNRKGIGALWPGRPMSDLDELDISAATVNIQINSLMRMTGAGGRTPFESGGRTWHVDDGYVSQLDRTMLEASRRGIIVSAIILIPQADRSADREYGRLVAHPDAHGSGIYVMPNMNSREGVMAYAAALEFLARRYSEPDKRHGRIHHWIMHNEVDMGWIWTNAGEKTALRYMDLYHKSMRLAHLIARQYNAHAQTFISLTHHWNDQVGARFYNARTMLEGLLAFSHAEGDFEWAIAHHPYPQDLRNPRVWEDDQAQFTLDTPKITYRNLEVLDAWVRQPKTLFNGTHRRLVHLSEQGLNSPDYSEKSLREQAAGMAYAWNKFRPLESIEVFHYHNWVDNRHEGGLRIGLRRFPDDAEEPLGKKPVWHVYRALDTPDESKETDFAKSVIGIKDWGEVRFLGPIR